MIYIVAFCVGLKFPLKIHLNTQCPLRLPTFSISVERKAKTFSFKIPSNFESFRWHRTMELGSLVRTNPYHTIWDEWNNCVSAITPSLSKSEWVKKISVSYLIQQANIPNKMANYNASNQTVLIDEPSAMIGGTFALLIAILGITVNSVTMYVILARKSIRLVFSMNLTDLSDLSGVINGWWHRFGFHLFWFLP